MGHIPVIIVIIVILGVGLYLIQAGVISKEWATTKQELSGGSGSSTAGTSGVFGGFPFGYRGTLPPLGGSGSGSKIGPPSAETATLPPAVDPKDIPLGYTVGQLSPYFHKVHLNAAPGPNGTMSLYASLDQKETVDVTGWEIRGNRAGEFLPQAIRLYDPLGISPATDIVLSSGDYVSIYANSSPANVRPNKCMGYLNGTNQFNPGFSGGCPYIDTSEIRLFTGQCQNYIYSLGGCVSPDFSNPQIPQNDLACIDYLKNHFTYRSCFDAHQSDADFLSNEVRVWMGGNPLDPFHDVVVLTDQNGLLVDTASY